MSMSFYWWLIFRLIAHICLSHTMCQHPQRYPRIMTALWSEKLTALWYIMCSKYALAKHCISALFNIQYISNEPNLSFANTRMFSLLFVPRMWNASFQIIYYLHAIYTVVSWGLLLTHQNVVPYSFLNISTPFSDSYTVYLQEPHVSCLLSFKYLIWDNDSYQHFCQSQLEAMGPENARF